MSESQPSVKRTSVQLPQIPVLVLQLSRQSYPGEEWYPFLPSKRQMLHNTRPEHSSIVIQSDPEPAWQGSGSRSEAAQSSLWAWRALGSERPDFQGTLEPIHTPNTKTPGSAHGHLGSQVKPNLEHSEHRVTTAQLQTWTHCPLKLTLGRSVQQSREVEVWH